MRRRRARSQGEEPTVEGARWGPFLPFLSSAAVHRERRAGHLHLFMSAYAHIFVFRDCEMLYSCIFIKPAVRGQT